MKKYRIEVDRMNGYQMLKYLVQVADQVDERAVDRSRTTQVHGMMYMQPAEIKKIVDFLRKMAYTMRVPGRIGSGSVQMTTEY